MGRRTKRHPVLRLVFFLYCGFMLYLLFFRSWRYNPALPYWEQVLANREMEPLKTIYNFISIIKIGKAHPYYFLCLSNMVGNTLLFVPAGILLPKLYRKWRPFWRFVLKAILTIALVETIQLFALLGVFDVDDIILNVLGMSFGYFLYYLFMRKE